MKEMDRIQENRTINSWVSYFSRCPYQKNKPHEADAELVEIKGNDSHLLAVTIDSIAEEITQGLYQDPFTMGWVTVMSNFSDLAAVGANPLGIVIAVSLDLKRDEKFHEGVAKGVAAACQEIKVFVLGGDTNTAPNISLSGCAIGLVPKEDKITRVGCHSGDVVFLSGGIGIGNAFGLARLARFPEEYFPESLYRPLARIKEGQLIRKYATCCMDTSDGLLITLDQLLRINDMGFFIEMDWKKILVPEVFQFCERSDVPHWFMSAGIHGEFELVFTVPPDRVPSFLEAARENSFHPIRLGVVQQEPSLVLTFPSGKKAAVDIAPLRNIWATADDDLSLCIREYHTWGKKWGLEL